MNKRQYLIDEFRTFIENLPDAGPDVLLSNETTIDLSTVCKELIALKTEVKLESRQFKSALESFKEVFNTLQQSHDVLAKELAERRQEQFIEIDKQQRALLKPLLLNLIELRDRVERGVLYSKTYRPNALQRLFKQESTFIMDLSEGQSMTLRRIDQILSNYEVRMLTTLHQPFDPHCMCAASVECRSDLPNGVVISELSKGFIWKNEVLRIAEVNVNKIED